MINIDKALDFSQKINQKKVATDYVFALHAIDLLKEIKYEEFDVELVLQYARANGLPWGDDVVYARRFAETNRNDIIMFARQKVAHFVKRLLQCYEELPKHDFIPVPMDAALAQHIDRTLRNLDRAELREWLMAEERWSKQPGLRARPSFQVASEIDLLEKQVRHAAEHFKVEAHDNKFTWDISKLFTSRLLRTIDEILLLKDLSDNSFNIKFWAAALSLIFRVAQPRWLPIGNTADLYQYVSYMHKFEFDRCITVMRDYSCLCPISIIHMDLDKAELPKVGNSQVIRVEPFSAVEKYLVLHQLKHLC